jgi:hypothetical protein
LITQLVQASTILDQDDKAILALVQLKNRIERSNQIQSIKESKSDDDVNRTMNTIRQQHELLNQKGEEDFLAFISSVQNKADRIIEQQQQKLAEQEQQLEVERQRQQQQQLDDEQQQQQQLLKEQEQQQKTEEQQRLEREDTVSSTVASNTSTPGRTNS